MNSIRLVILHALRMFHRLTSRIVRGTRGLGLIYLVQDRIASAEPIVATVDGHRMVLDLHVRYNRYLFYRGLGEIHELRPFCDSIKPGMTVIDVGANIGVFTLAAARLVGPRGRVIAFEPLLRNYRYLVSNLVLNNYSHIAAEQMAVTNRDGHLELRVWGPDNVTVDRTRSEGPTAETITVPCCRLDTYLSQHGIDRVAVIKIDIEGAEVFALEGMQALLRAQPRPRLVLELHPDLLQPLGYTPQEVLADLRRIGYHLYRLVSTKEYPIADADLSGSLGELDGHFVKVLRVFAVPQEDPAAMRQ